MFAKTQATRRRQQIWWVGNRVSYVVLYCEDFIVSSTPAFQMFDKATWLIRKFWVNSARNCPHRSFRKSVGEGPGRQRVEPHLSRLSHHAGPLFHLYNLGRALLGNFVTSLDPTQTHGPLWYDPTQPQCRLAVTGLKIRHTCNLPSPSTIPGEL